MITILIAKDGNDLEIPCRFFKNMKEGKKRCDELFGFEGKYIEEKGIFRWEIALEDDTKKSEKISNELFTSWYYGCGGPYEFILKQIDYDTKFVGWDLDLD